MRYHCSTIKSRDAPLRDIRRESFRRISLHFCQRTQSENSGEVNGPFDSGNEKNAASRAVAYSHTKCVGCVYASRSRNMHIFVPDF